MSDRLDSGLSVAGLFNTDPLNGATSSLERLALCHEVPTHAFGPLLVAGDFISGEAPGGSRCALMGRIADLGRLASDQSRSGDRRPLPDLLAAGWERQGDAILHELRGEFILLLWDPARRRGIMARDQLGGRSLYWSRIGSGLAFAEQVRDLLPLLPTAPAPDAVTTVDWISVGVVPYSRSFYRGVQRLPPGHLIRLNGGRWAVEQWWSPSWHGTVAGAEPELEELVVDGLDSAVRRSLAGSCRAAVQLSGGLDSSCVAAAAVAAGAAPIAYSGVFPEHEDVDESSLISDVTEWLAIEGVRTSLRGGGALAAALEYLRDWRLPVGSPNHALWEPVYARTAADGNDVTLDGEGGDEVFGTSAYLVADTLRAARPLAAWKLTRRLTGVGAHPSTRALLRLARNYGALGLLPHRVHRRARRARGSYRHAPVWLRPEAARAHVESYDPWAWKRGSGPLWWRHQSWILSRGREELDAHGYLRRQALEHGLADRHPFIHDLDLVELSLRLPPEPAFDPHYDRVRLRRGMRGRLPDSVRLRKNKSYFTPLVGDVVGGSDGGMLRELLGSPRAEIQAFVRPDVLRAALLDETSEQYVGAKLESWGTIWRLGVAECWLRSLADARFTDDLLARCSVGLLA